MTDLEITRLCAAAAGVPVGDKPTVWGTLTFMSEIHRRDDGMKTWRIYNPLQDDAQAMALVRKFKLNIGQLSTGDCQVFMADDFFTTTDSKDLSRAICECVAQMQAAKA